MAKAAAFGVRPPQILLPSPVLNAIQQATSLGNKVALTIPRRQLLPVATFTRISSKADKLASRSKTTVWFKHDLRVDDHPGLALVTQQDLLAVPFFCFDPALHCTLLRTPQGLESLVGAVTALRQALQERGSTLVVRLGPVAQQLPALAQEVCAGLVITEEDVESQWCDAVQAATTGLSAEVSVQFWNLKIFEEVAKYPEDWQEFVRLQMLATQPIAAPAALAPLPQGIVPGEMPSIDKLRHAVLEANSREHLGEVADVAQHMSQPIKWQSDIAAAIAGGEPAALQAFQEYLRCKTPAEGQLTTMRQAVEATTGPATPLGCFPQIFATALALGVMSRRRVYHAASQYLQQSKQGVIQLARKWAVPAESAVLTAKGNDFHYHLARGDQAKSSRCGQAPRHWRWSGYITDYFVGTPEHDNHNKPAFLLVHGFGAFAEQWRGQFKGLTQAGYKVYAVTLPGYGRSEKPAKAYSQGLWRDFLRDFVLDIVRRPVVVVGNSIGGYLAATLAADYPMLVKGLVLLNSAGKVVPGYAPSSEDAAAPSRNSLALPLVFIDLVSAALFFYLEKSVARTLKRLYPVAPERVDDWLEQEILRAARDPGAKGVFRSVFFLPPPRPLNHLVADLYAGPTLVLQGRLDPLSDSVGRARSLEAACPNVTIQLLSAGHCPHDEVPELVNQHLAAFAKSVDSIARSKPAEELASMS